MPDFGAGNVAVGNLLDEQSDSSRRVQNAVSENNLQPLADFPHRQTTQRLRGIVLDLIDEETDTGHPWLSVGVLA
jgi:hypothetical protein